MMLQTGNSMGMFGRLAGLLSPAPFEDIQSSPRMPQKSKLAEHAKSSEDTKKDALDRLDQAKKNTTQSTFRMWDKHTDMVQKAQELSKTRSRQEAIARQNQKQRDEQRQLLAQRALANANRSEWMDALSLQRKDKAKVIQRSSLAA